MLQSSFTFTSAGVCIAAILADLTSSGFVTSNLCHIQTTRRVWRAVSVESSCSVRVCASSRCLLHPAVHSLQPDRPVDAG